ncbi:MAG: hypothetical protein K6F28_01740 [Lachnospiraceae bacterium]|nr:hypothetical protein [Lachnospiraceae bacterium]
MKKFVYAIPVIIMILPVLICSCGKEEPVKKTPFGQVDAMKDGDILTGITDPRKDMAKKTDKKKDGAGDKDVSATESGDEPKEIDVRRLSDDLKSVAGLCDAINIASVEMGKGYTEDDAAFIWHCIHAFACRYGEDSFGFERVGDTLDADPDTITKIGYSMFGKLKELPTVSEIAAYGEEDGDHVSVSTDLKYRFKDEDPGSFLPEIRTVNKYPDSTLEMEVALEDASTGEESVSFIYTLRANTRDTTTGALFDYEITGARAADRLTEDKLNGVPFLACFRRQYGWKDLEEEDEGYGNIVEILKFSSFDENEPGIKALNEAIEEDIVGLADAPRQDGQWVEIMSYPLTTSENVQVAVTFKVCPADGTDPDIRCYAFNKSKKRPLEESDLKELAGKDTDLIAEEVKDLYMKDDPGGDPGLITYKGFIVKDDGSQDVFFTVEGDPDEGRAGRLVAYDTALSDIRYVSATYVIDEEETDDFKPRLYHGRKDK